MSFKVFAFSDTSPYITAKKASGTVIEEGKLITLNAGLVVEAAAASTALGYAPFGAEAGTEDVTIIDPTKIDQVLFEATADAPFADTNRWALVDLVINGTEQQVDLWSSTTQVFKVSASQRNTVGETTVYVTIDKSI